MNHPMKSKSSSGDGVQQVRVIFFDLGKTLVTGTERSARRLLGSRLNLSEKETSRVGKMIMTHGALNPSSLADAFGRMLPRLDSRLIQDAVQAVWSEQMHSVREVPGALDILRQLNEKGFKIGFISNTWHPFWLGFSRACPEMVNMAEYVFLSYRVGLKKPSPELYLRAVKATGEIAQSCAMVGDSYELDVTPARRAQMTTVWLLSNLNAEKECMARALRGEELPPDWTAESLESLLQFFIGTGQPWKQPQS
jgi:HAD superfamily hydrolase (TIGR01549 family)